MADLSDLSPSDVFIFDYLNDKMFGVSSPSVDEVTSRIKAIFEAIHTVVIISVYHR
jgi:hypothetical protein